MPKHDRLALGPSMHFWQCEYASAHSVFFLDDFKKQCHHWDTANQNKFCLFFFLDGRGKVTLVHMPSERKGICSLKSTQNTLLEGFTIEINFIIVNCLTAYRLKTFVPTASLYL